MGKDQVPGIAGFRILATYTNQTAFTTQPECSKRILNSRIPVKMGISETIGQGIVCEHAPHLWIINRKAVLCRNPQTAIAILHNTFHTIIDQAILLCQCLKALLIVLNDTSIETIAITAQPQRTIVSLTECRNLVDNSGCWIIQKMRDSPTLEFPVLKGLQVHNPYALHTTHPQMTILCNNRSDTAAHVTTTIKGFFQMSRLETEEEHTVVAADPHTLIDRVVGQSTDEVSQADMFRRQVQPQNGPWGPHVKQTDSSAPSADP